MTHFIIDLTVLIVHIKTDNLDITEYSFPAKHDRQISRSNRKKIPHFALPKLKTFSNPLLKLATFFCNVFKVSYYFFLVIFS